MWKRGTALLTALLMLFSCALAEDVYLDEPTPEAAEETADDTLTARDDLINRIIALGQELYIKANGKSQRAHYKRDIYVCKNFTTYLFRQNRDDFCMAEYPDVQLLVPNNLSAAKSKPYSYGIEWEDISPEKGNPFYIAAQFKYDKNLSEEENMALACDFMRQAQRGDYFQMSAKYEYGTGAHSAIMLGYDPETDEIHWMDSNMRGVVYNDFGRLYAKCPGIRAVLCNGAAAHRLFIQSGWAGARQVIRLPSTSPAYTMAYEKKREAWRAALCALQIVQSTEPKEERI